MLPLKYLHAGIFCIQMYTHLQQMCQQSSALVASLMGQIKSYSTVDFCCCYCCPSNACFNNAAVVVAIITERLLGMLHNH